MNYPTFKFWKEEKKYKSTLYSNLTIICFTQIFNRLSYESVQHTVNFCSEMGQTKHVSGKNIFCSVNAYKIRGKRIFEIVHCPFEGRAKLHHLCRTNGLVGQCQLGGNLKGQCTISKILFPLLLYTFIEQNIFFPETCFAYPISEQKFTVCAPLITVVAI